MRKSHAVRAAVIAAAVASACAALANPAAAANASVTVSDDRFTPSAVTINQGETVTWTFRESGHNVESSSASFESDFLSNGDTFSHTFNQPGTFSYVCGAHDDMRGSVTVNAAAPGTTPPPGTGPGGGQAPGTGNGGNGSPTVDSAPPTVSGLKARRRMLRFRSSEKARVSVSIRRVRRGRSALVVKRLRGTAKRGANRMRIKGRLARGRYRVVITARDAAGNRSAPKTTKLVVR